MRGNAGPPMLPGVHTHDSGDVAFLVRRLVAPEEVFERITRYYPQEQVPPKTRFLVEELFGADGIRPAPSRK